MSNTIRPKVSEALKQIASSDRSGNSKAKVDTKNEFKALQDYLSGNYEELNTTEKNTIQRLLDSAKEYLKNNIGNEQQSNAITDKKTNGDDNSVTQDQYIDNVTVEQKNENNDDITPNGDDDSVTHDKYQDNVTVDQKNENNDDIIPNGDDDSVSKDDFFNNAYDKLEKEIQENTTGIENTYNNQNKMPGKKVMHDGKMCIEMPNGHLYDMQGRRIK